MSMVFIVIIFTKLQKKQISLNYSNKLFNPFVVFFEIYCFPIRLSSVFCMRDIFIISYVLSIMFSRYPVHLMLMPSILVIR